MSTRGVAGMVLLATFTLACSGEPDGGPDTGVSVRDSAGVRIVESDAGRSAGWRVDTAAVFTTGWAAGDPSFAWLQAGRILPDGGAVVGEFTQGALYRLAADGSVAATWGRKGEGPGEFQSFDAIVVDGDSILVSDNRLRRITWLSADGELLATGRLPGAFVHRASSVMGDGRLLLVPGDGYSALLEPARQTWMFETQPILAADMARGQVDTLAVLEHLRRWLGARGAPPGWIRVMGTAGGFPGGFAWARSDRPEVRWYDSAGALTQIARWNEAPEPFTAEYRAWMVGAFEEAWEATGQGEANVARLRAQLDESLDRHDGPLPYWYTLVGDREGNVWTRRYGPLVAPSSDWRVVTRDGIFGGWVELPGVAAVLDITDDRILVVLHDEMDVPAVALFRLIKEDP